MNDSCFKARRLPRQVAINARRIAVLLAFPCAAWTAGARTTRAELEIVVPAYFYPSNNSPWATMTAAAGDASITAIMNPFNGPGNSRDNNYVNAVNAFRAAGGRVIGYVYTSYGARSLAAVTADVDKYRDWYAIDGIFVDEMANTGPVERLNYYKSIYDHVKAVDPEWEVMGNPGTNTIEAYLTLQTADRFMVFENVGSQYPSYAPSAWNYKYDSARFVHLVHSEPSATNMQSHLVRAVRNNAGGIYVTHDILANPWDTLPSYWQAEVGAVAAINASFLAGDFNEDGGVDGDDLALWTSGHGQFEAGAAHRDGDADGDGDVDGADFLAWQRDHGQSSLPPLTETAGGAVATSVPEPGGALIGMAGALSVRCMRRQFRRRRRRYRLCTTP